MKTEPKNYQDRLVRSIIETIKPLPGSDSIAKQLRAGDPRAVKQAYDLARRHGLVVQYN